MLILAIETSCDETAAAVVRDGTNVLSSAVASQIDLHAPYMGVVPELASRAHVSLVNGVIEKALREAKLLSKNGSLIPALQRLDAIAYTRGPGLVGALLVGRMAAEALAWSSGVPLVGINHIEGHLLSAVIPFPKIRPPFLGMVVSGGHTELVHARGWSHYRLIGRTRDDAAGEAFDKVAKMMGLGYPGGPVIDRLARQGKAERAPFPRPWLPGTWDFSFSGLKTAVLYHVRKKSKWSLSEKRDISAGFQAAVVDVLVGKAIAATKALGLRQIVVGGGVAANSALRAILEAAARENKFDLYIAPPALCTDNAAMIGAAAHFMLTHEKSALKGPRRVEAHLHIPLETGRVPVFKP